MAVKMHLNLLTLLTSWALLAAVFATTRNFYKRHENSRVYGTIVTTLKGASVIRCSAACEVVAASCRAFNYHRSTDTCTLYSAFRGRVVDSAYDIYFDRDMYQDYGFMKYSGRLVFYPPTDTNTYWYYVDDICGTRWGLPFIPKDMSDWYWMKDVFQEMQYTRLYVPLSEYTPNAGYYYWYNGYTAPGDLGITIEPDGYDEITITGADGSYSYYEYIDCGVHDPVANPDKDVILVDCMIYITLGYICEAGIPDQEAYDIHPYLEPVANRSAV